MAVDAIWRAATENLLNTFTKIDISSTYTLPSKADLGSGLTQVDIQEYQRLFEKTAQRFNALSEQKYNLLVDIKALSFRLVSDAGRLRSRLIDRCNTQELCEDVGSFSERSLTGILTELRILPLKFLAGGLNKIVEFKAKINKGFDGWVDVVRQILILLVLILLPFLVHRSLNWLSYQLNLVREKILERSIMNYKHRTGMGVWISRLNPFVPSIGMI